MARTAAQRRRTRGIQGVSQLRKTLRALGKADGSITQGIKKAIEDWAEAAVATAKGYVPIKEGDLGRSIDYVLSSDKLTAVVGPGIRGATTIKKRSGSYANTARQAAGKKLNFSASTKKDQFQLFKGYWLEYGTKGRKTADGSYVGAISPRPWMRPTAQAVIPVAIENIREEVQKALRQAGQRGR